MAVVCWATSAGIEKMAGHTFVAKLINVGVSVAAGAGVFYGIAYLLGIEELKTATAVISRRFAKRR
jgi:hypothetical protein